MARFKRKQRGFASLSKALKKVKSKSKDIVKKSKPFVVNDEPKIQGEGTIGISPFDDYFLFNIFTEIDGEDVPLDLRNTGDLYMSFFDTSDEIIIRNIKNIDGIDPRLGQVVFRITKAQSKKILNFSDNRFYISSKLKTGEDTSDESVLYVGKFFDFATQKTKGLQDQANKTLTESKKVIKEQEEIINDLSKSVNELKQEITKLTTTNRQLRNNNNNLSNRITSLKNALGKEHAARLEAEADEARAKELQKKSQSQVKALTAKLNTKEVQTMATKEVEKQVKQNNQKNSRSFKSGDNTSKQKSRSTSKSGVLSRSEKRT